MTREEKELIFNRLFELEGQHVAFAENIKDNSYCEAIADVKHIIDGIKETSLPSNLDKASEEYQDEHTKYIQIPHSRTEIEYDVDIVDAFKAGADWMARQGVTKKAVIGMATEDVEINVSQRVLDALDICSGDKVIVQIRKSE